MVHPTPPSLDRRRLEDLAVSPNGFAFDPKSGQSFTINGSGLVALECLQSGATPLETAHKLAATYGVAVEIALGAVEGFMRQLARCLP